MRSPGHFYAAIRTVHVACVLGSGLLFAVRGIRAVGNPHAPGNLALKRLSYGIDTVLLLAALALASISRQWPFAQGWLTAKLALLCAYVAAGLVALRLGRGRGVRAGALVLAWTLYAQIIAVAVTRDPLGLLRLLP